MYRDNSFQVAVDSMPDGSKVEKYMIVGFKCLDEVQA